MSLLIFEKQGWQQPVLQELKGEGGGEEEFRRAREHEKEDIGTSARTSARKRNSGVQESMRRRT